MFDPKTLIRVIVDSHPPPPAQNGKIRALSIFAPRAEGASATKQKSVNSRVPAHTRFDSNRLALFTFRRRCPLAVCFGSNRLERGGVGSALSSFNFRMARHTLATRNKRRYRVYPCNFLRGAQAR